MDKGQSKSQWAMPDFKKIVGAVVIQIEESSNYNIVLFLESTDSINWEKLQKMRSNPDQIDTLGVIPSAWVYRCCDYSVGVLFGLAEHVTGKIFRKMAKPNNPNIDLSGVQMYDFREYSPAADPMELTI